MKERFSIPSTTLFSTKQSLGITLENQSREDLSCRRWHHNVVKFVRGKHFSSQA